MYYTSTVIIQQNLSFIFTRHFVFTDFIMLYQNLLKVISSELWIKEWILFKISNKKYPIIYYFINIYLTDPVPLRVDYRWRNSTHRTQRMCYRTILYFWIGQLSVNYGRFARLLNRMWESRANRTLRLPAHHQGCH